MERTKAYGYFFGLWFAGICFYGCHFITYSNKLFSQKKDFFMADLMEIILLDVVFFFT